jgi:hypothetical protein
MTDFFGDLEQEIRAAHPRRSRPVVPVRGIAVTAAVAATLVAVVLALGALSPSAEREVAAPGPDQGWTEYAPLNCPDQQIVDGRIPDEVVDRFAILRGDEPPVDLPAARVPHAAAEVIRQSLRRVDGPEGYRYVVAVVRLTDDRCRPGELGMCLISMTTDNGICGGLGKEEFIADLVEDRSDHRDFYAVLAEDRVREARLDGATRVRIEGNVGFLLR